MSKVVLITGASSGIGKSIAQFLVSKGMIVYGTSRNPAKVTSDTIKMLALDVTDTETIEKAVDTIVQNEGRLDVLINNAGKGITGPIEDTPIEEMKKAYNTNFFGALDVIKSVLPQMRKQKSGLIINITSIAGYMGIPFRGIYCSSKAAFKVATESLRIELKEFGINVTNVAPGGFATNIAAGRYHTPVFEDSAYKDKYAKNLALVDEHVDAGLQPIVMAKAIFRIIHTKNPKVHYEIGAFMEKFSIILKCILPDRIYEKLIMNHYKI